MTFDADPPPPTHKVPAPRPTTEPALPPHPLDAEWSIEIDGKTYGPFTGHQLKGFVIDGRLEPSTKIMRAGGLNWIAASTDTTLRKLFPAVGPPPLPARLPVSGIQAGERSTVVQVNNYISNPPVWIDPGADKSPGVALILSLIIVGVGQFYNGDVGKGIGMMVLCVLLWTFYLGWIINIWAMIDAYGTAKTHREKHRIYMASLQ